MSPEDRTSFFAKTSSRILVYVSLLIILSLACNLPVSQTAKEEKPPGFVETSVAETIAAQEAGGPSGVDTQNQPPTDTYSPPVTATPSLTPTQTLTPTPDIAMIQISENTNCRTGPGVIYDWLVTMQKGDESEAIARDPTGDYWYIRRPGQPTSFCWLWGKYATPSGPYDSLPIYTPVPTPTVGFNYKVTYKELLGPCPAYALVFQIDNIGSFTLESWKTSAVDHTGGSNPEINQLDAFVEFTGCSWTGTQVDLTPGEAFYVLMVFNNNPTGHDITTKIKICTEDGMAGDCLKKEVRFTP